MEEVKRRGVRAGRRKRDGRADEGRPLLCCCMVQRPFSAGKAYSNDALDLVHVINVPEHSKYQATPCETHDGPTMVRLIPTKSLQATSNPKPTFVGVQRGGRLGERGRLQPWFCCCRCCRCRTLCTPPGGVVDDFVVDICGHPRR